MRDTIRERIAAIRPYDAIEYAHRTAALAWVDSGAPLFRVRSPDLPSQHLVSYAVLLDRIARSVLMVRHRKAGLWLPTGGHVDVGEDPRLTAKRELSEELGVPAEPGEFGDQAAFLSLNRTRGQGSHLDVSLWFVSRIRAGVELRPDWREFDEVRWWPLASTDWTTGQFDPNMARFAGKLSAG